MFMVRAEVLPMSRYTARLSTKAAVALPSRRPGWMTSVPAEKAAQSAGASMTDHGRMRATAQQGLT